MLAVNVTATAIFTAAIIATNMTAGEKLGCLLLLIAGAAVVILN